MLRVRNLGAGGGGLRLFPVSCCQTPGSRSPPAVGLSVDSRGFGVAGVSGLRALGFRGCRGFWVAGFRVSGLQASGFRVSGLRASGFSGLACLQGLWV